MKKITVPVNPFRLPPNPRIPPRIRPQPERAAHLTEPPNDTQAPISGRESRLSQNRSPRNCPHHRSVPPPVRRSDRISARELNTKLNLIGHRARATSPLNGFGAGIHSLVHGDHRVEREAADREQVSGYLAGPLRTLHDTCPTRSRIRADLTGWAGFCFTPDDKRRQRHDTAPNPTPACGN